MFDWLLDLNTLNIVTFSWLAFWTIFAIKRLAAGQCPLILFIIPIYFLFFGVPLLQDVLIGTPDYSIFPGFQMASRDNFTGIIYCFYISAVPVLWWWTIRNSKNTGVDREEPQRNVYATPLFQNTSPILNFILVIITISPAVFLIFSPDPQTYLNYAISVTAGFASNEAQEYHSNFIAPFSLLSVFSGAMFLASQKRITALSFGLILIFNLLALFLFGKRTIVTTEILIILFVFWHKGYLKGARFFSAILISLVIVSGFSQFYQSNIRKIGQNVELPFSELYDAYRLDYARDAEVKMSIFAELYPETIQILEHRGQSFLFYLTMYARREEFPDKPLPYAQYMTSASFMSTPKLWGWGLTTSLLEETIANFSWFGMILGPLIISTVCRIGDTFNNNVLIQLMTVIISALLLIVEMVAFAPLFFSWILLVVYFSLKKKLAVN